MTWWTIATIAEVVWIVMMATGIVLERRSPVATIAWIAVLAWLPLLGVAIYFFFGPRRLRRRTLRRAAGQKLLAHALDSIREDSEHPIARAQLARMIVGAGEAPPMRVTAVDLHFDGETAYRSIFEAIDAAKHHVHLEYYIYEPGKVGAELRDRLTACAKRGVEVRLLIDWVGSHGLRARFFDPLVAAGGHLAWFNPVASRRLNWRFTNFRSHRKICVVDGVVGFTGGMNIADCHGGDDMVGSAHLGARLSKGPANEPAKYWRDTNLRMEGSAVRALARVFLEDWYFATEAPPPTGDAYLIPPSKDGDDFVQIVASGPDQSMYAIQKLYFGAITSARERVWLETPYFVPDEAITEALVSAALRGVDVRLIVPERGDNRVVDYAARSYFPELLRVGAQVLEYTPRFIHAKTCVVDSDLSIIGTANLDNRSFRLNFEVVAAVYGEKTNRELAAAFERDLEGAHSVKNKELRREPFRQRAAEAVARLFSPML
jgi:cardiolipin synthase